MKKLQLTLILALAATCIPTSLNAQDTRERIYYYEILDPRHEFKPQINGFAPERIKENINRGLTAVPTNDGEGVFLSWRLLENDDPQTSFHIYRMINGRNKRLTNKPLKDVCHYIDKNPVSGEATYWVSILNANKKEIQESEKVTIHASKLKNYRSIKLNREVRAGKVGVADLNGDGVYDYVIRTPHTNVDPGMPGDMNGSTYQIEAYLSDGTFLWSKDLGQGIEPGIWYSPYIVYDFNGDGKAEVALKTAPESTKRNDKGRVDGGEEYLSIWDGMTGQEIDRVDWPERNDRYGNLIRQNRNQIGMAYLDGKTPYILACRGTYKLMVVDAWQLNGNKLERAWRWDGDEENPIVRSMGAHSMVSGDVDNDGREEILLGSCMIDDNGTLLWSSGTGHPDKVYLTDIDPEREGMEVFLALEPYRYDGRGVCMVDAKTGEQIWNIGHDTHHVGNGMVADIDPIHKGLECFASEDKKGGSTDRYYLTAKGEYLSRNDNVPPCGDWIWWDGDLLREQIKSNFNWEQPKEKRRFDMNISKWQGENLTNDIQGSILMVADLFGDWREEIVTSLPGELRIYSTNIPAKDRRVTLMQDHIYRNYVAHRSMGYPQAPVPSYYLGE